MLESGYVRLYRSMLTWEWYDDINTKIVFLHLLLTVNYEPQKWRGITIERGQRVASYAKISKEVRLSVQSVRTAIKHLISTGELTHQTTAEYGLFTVSNYDKYQDITPMSTVDQQAANSQPTVDQQAANNNGRKLNKAKKANKEELPPISPTSEMQGESLVFETDTGAEKSEYYSKTSAFDKFWEAYPKRAAKGEAQKAFAKLKVDSELLGIMLKAIKSQMQSDQWRRDGGQYIPHPATWLNQRRWEDEAPKTVSSTTTSFDIADIEALMKRNTEETT